MPDLSVTIVMPNGGARRADIPDDLPAGEIIKELTSLLKLPTIGPDGRPMGYRLDSKALGRELWETETLKEAQVPKDDRLMLTADITAGAVGVDENPRMRRLRSDYDLIQELNVRGSLVSVEAIGTERGMLAERYIVTYRCKGIAGVDRRNEPIFSNLHKVEIYLHSQYPQRWPGMKWLTPIWHPNISHLNGTVCIDAAWWAASRSLDRLVIMMGEMVQYKNYHDDPTKPPFPWDADAARWSREYRSKHPGAFPVDSRELLRPERVKLHKAEPEKKPRIRIK
jgi:ubiquitin-protein ligase